MMSKEERIRTFTITDKAVLNFKFKQKDWSNCKYKTKCIPQTFIF